MRILVAAALSLLLATAMSAQPARAVQITNQSSAHWCLKANEDPMAVVLVQGPKDPAPVALNGAHPNAAYGLAPGESCQLRFDQKEDLPTLVGLGAVDITKVGQGQVVLTDLLSVDGLPHYTEAKMAAFYGEDLTDPTSPYFGSWGRVRQI